MGKLSCAVFVAYVQRIFKNIFSHAEQISQVLFFFSLLYFFVGITVIIFISLISHASLCSVWLLSMDVIVYSSQILLDILIAPIESRE